MTSEGSSSGSATAAGAPRAPGLAAPDLLRRGLLLEYITLLWNVIGTAVVVFAALASESVALAGFGLDSGIEILASIVVVWQLRDTVGTRERPSLVILGASFCALALYVAGQAAYALVVGDEPDPSTLGIAWTAVTFLVMLGLAAGKARTGRALGNRVLLTEGRVTLVDAYLAGAVLVGLVLNAAAGLWWADPLAGLVIVAYALKEGVGALREARA
jgi:divalent metal cation (Fe/Co/Zn/Cd) transporter